VNASAGGIAQHCIGAESATLGHALRYEEIDFDAASGESDCVKDTRWNGLQITCTQIALSRNLCLHREVNAALEHPQDAPSSAGNTVVSP
jgi:hypothetical protein